MHSYLPFVSLIGIAFLSHFLVLELRHEFYATVSLLYQRDFLSAPAGQPETDARSVALLRQIFIESTRKMFFHAYGLRQIQCTAWILSDGIPQCSA